MNLRHIALFAALCIAALPIQAADEAKPAGEKKLTASQQRMADCNKEAAGQKGPERKAFMAQCMKGDAAPATPQNRMKECNKQAGEKKLKGDERKAFMSDCLKAK